MWASRRTNCLWRNFFSEILCFSTANMNAGWGSGHAKHLAPYPGYFWKE
jgi:hypothetical protein